MIINNSNYSIAELLEMLDRRDLEVNRDYQRASGLWPTGPRSYFIDTILENYPFPKLYLYEHIDRGIGKIKKEVVDGQQRLFTIKDFVGNKFALTGDTKFRGLKYSDLDEDDRIGFLSYIVSVDVIRNATKSEILQMFRRMNAYTLPLNEAEKMHSSYHGDFKWFINNLCDDLNEFFVEFQVFTSRQIVRMADSEFLADLVLAGERGIVSTSPGDLRNLYKTYDEKYPGAEVLGRKFRSVIEFIVSHFGGLRGTYLAKPYALHSLMVAMMHSAEANEKISRQVRGDFVHGRYCADPETSMHRLRALADAHEAKESDGPHRLYVWGCSGGTNRAGRRLARMIEILWALGYENIVVVDDELAGLLPT